MTPNPYLCSSKTTTPLSIRLFQFLLIFLCATACAPERDNMPIAFYHWKSRLQLSDSTVQQLQQLGAGRLYVKYMDVDLEGGRAVPKAGIRLSGDAYRNFEIVPCVFITNRSFQSGLPPEQLAEQIWKYLQAVNTEAGVTPREYQFDCDWSPGTQQAYFDFLRHIRRRSGPATLSATIRLHQYRYPEQTGIPPVDHGSLMFYNMGDIEDVKEPNSILNNATAERYLTGAAPYALPLDIALPLFSWTLVYRLGELHLILPNTSEAELAALPGVQKTDKHRYRVQQNLYFGGQYLNTGDVLRHEAPGRDALLRAARQLQPIANDRSKILFYHLDEHTLDQFPPDFLLELRAALSR